MGAAEKLKVDDSKQILSPVGQANEVKSGIEYYDQKVFPVMGKGKAPFNWYAGLFSAYWLPYKGLWKEFAMWLLPYSFLVGVLDELGAAWGVMGAAIGLVVGVGSTANKSYFEHLKSNPSSKSNVLAGIGGVIAYLVAFVLITQLCAEFAAGYRGFKAKQAKYAPTSSTASSREVASTRDSTPTYTSTAMAVMDGDEAIGKIIQFQAMFGGVQNVDGVPVIFATDLQNSSVWYIGFSDRYKPQIANMKPSTLYTFQCEIRGIDSPINVCFMD
jgi:hypothetical protein